MTDDYLDGRADALAGRPMKRPADLGEPAGSPRVVDYCTGYHEVHGEADHDWLPPRRFTATGPMEGEWFVQDCRLCNAACILDQPGQAGSAFDSVIAQLEHKGCDPRPSNEGDM